ncbi:hypothetical protein GGF31_003239 [Allomyces arbusculus]|nr:hypothetical protein GGF31_003239 [Allomyces arbusculus]
MVKTVSTASPDDTRRHRYAAPHAASAPVVVKSKRGRLHSTGTTAPANRNSITFPTSGHAAAPAAMPPPSPPPISPLPLDQGIVSDTLPLTWPQWCGSFSLSVVGTLLRWILRSLLVLMGIVAVLMMFPTLQRGLIYMNWVHWPLGDLSAPEQFGLRHGFVHNVRLVSTKGATLGAWHLVSDPTLAPVRRSVLDPAAADPVPPSTQIGPNDTVILYLHGNAGNRATGRRVRFYQTLQHVLAQAAPTTTRTHILAFDYRGFGDSTGSPDQQSVTHDAETALAYLASRGALPHRTVVIGHSLGTGVSAQLMRTHTAATLILLAPFTSLPDAALQYPFFPVLRILAAVAAPLTPPGVADRQLRAWVAAAAADPWDTRAVLPSIARRMPVLIIHGAQDRTIPVTHAHALVGRRASTRKVPGGEGRVVTGTSGVRLVEVAHGGHDDLHDHALVQDTLAQWIVDAVERATARQVSRLMADVPSSGSGAVATDTQGP